ncbi:beta-glucosidase [Motilibacter peucedani]|uniref:Beta-glucosidase n=1 Tax=Motilibacter peucedani TaxID=598650 RepID=A0A420XT81_9ACTN|nr:glycoside hydrolase family 3 C-terminal domain-containing protein [Motilibacter peucedani]RKS79961.1 beta-glucosidase [Motilibacter peucedani]
MAETTAYDAAVAAVRAGASPVEQARALYAQLTPDERLGLLDGDEDFWPGMQEMIEQGYNLRPYVHGAVARLGIPGLRFSDGPRGVVMGRSTAFPVSMARGATWDVELEERIGDAIGAEARAQGANFFGGVCINLPRHPAWGRIQETYSEDPVLLGEMGAALTRGTQRHVMACVKHYALNSMENARFTVDVTVDDATLHEVYLPHFRRVVEEGVAAVMSAYNSVNGQWCGQNEQLLTDVLRDQWHFEGVTVSDFIWGLRDAATSLRHGLDIEEPLRQQRAQHLPADLEQGRASWDDVESSGLRSLSTQLRFAAALADEAPSADVVVSDAHRALARGAGARAMVLLRNEDVDGRPLLPLDASTLSSVAVVGRLGDVANTGDHGSSDVRAPSVVTALDGLRAALPDADVRFEGSDDPEAAARAAADADVAVVVVGYTAEDEGEYVSGEAASRPELLALYPPAQDGADAVMDKMGSAPGEALLVGSAAMGGDRGSLRLRPVDEEIVRAVAAANPRTVVAVVAAGAVVMEGWREQVPGLLLAWYSGMEGGHSLADVLLGDAVPSGRLPFSVPTSEEHLPAFDRDATAVTYDRWHGQRLLDRLGVPAAYPLGFGLSYTTFSLGEPSVEPGDGALHVEVPLTNTGHVRAHHVVQVYGTRLDGDRAGERALLGFAVAEVGAGETVAVRVRASLRPLSRWDAGVRDLVTPAGAVRVEAASYAGDPDARAVEVRLP